MALDGDDDDDDLILLPERNKFDDDGEVSGGEDNEVNNENIGEENQTEEDPYSDNVWDALEFRITHNDENDESIGERNDGIEIVVNENRDDEEEEENIADEEIRNEEEEYNEEDITLDFAASISTSIDPIDYGECPFMNDIQKQFIRLTAFAVLKMTQKHNKQLLCGVPEDIANDVIFGTNQSEESYHKHAHAQLQKCRTKRDILIESEIILQENHKYTHIIKETMTNDKELYQERRLDTRHALEECLTQNNHDELKAEDTANTLQKEVQAVQECQEKEEQGCPLLVFLQSKHIVSNDVTKLLKKDMVRFFQLEQLCVGKNKVKIDQKFPDVEYRLKMEHYLLQNTNDVNNPDNVYEIE